MHDLGHNLGLLHGGADCFNLKPNYVSVMNYRFYLAGIPVGAAPGDAVTQSCATDADCNASDHAVGAHCSVLAHTCFRIDYSDRSFNSLDEGGWAGGLDENVGLQGGVNNTDISYRRTGVAQFTKVPTNGTPIDWNQDGSFTAGVTAEVNGDGTESVLESQDDWASTSINGVRQFINLKFKFQCDANFGD